VQQSSTQRYTDEHSELARLVRFSITGVMSTANQFEYKVRAVLGTDDWFSEDRERTAAWARRAIGTGRSGRSPLRVTWSCYNVPTRRCTPTPPSGSMNASKPLLMPSWPQHEG